MPGRSKWSSRSSPRWNASTGIWRSIRGDSESIEPSKPAARRSTLDNGTKRVGIATLLRFLLSAAARYDVVALRVKILDGARLKFREGEVSKNVDERGRMRRPARPREIGPVPAVAAHSRRQLELGAAARDQVHPGGGILPARGRGEAVGVAEPREWGQPLPQPGPELARERAVPAADEDGRPAVV